MSPEYNKYDFLVDYPVSAMWLADMINEKFQTEGITFFNNWNKKVSSMIWLAYFGLLIRGIIKIESENIKSSTSFGILSNNYNRFIPKLSEKKIEGTLGWIETQIVASINNCQPNNDKDKISLLRYQSKLAVDGLLGTIEEYKSPYKKIVEKAILYDKHNLWDNKYETSLLGFKRTIELKIDNIIKDKLINYLNQIKSLEEKFIAENNKYNRFRSWIKNSISIEIDNRRINSKYD